MVMVYPNAGLPNELGDYDEPPEMTAKLVSDWAENGWSTSSAAAAARRRPHITAIAEAVKGVQAARSGTSCRRRSGSRAWKRRVSSDG